MSTSRLAAGLSDLSITTPRAFTTVKATALEQEVSTDQFAEGCPYALIRGS
jgi:hypothetical protein